MRSATLRCANTNLSINVFTSQGASLIRMIEKVVGTEALKAGLKLYMQKHEYANTHNSDLWAAVSEVRSASNSFSCKKAPFQISKKSSAHKNWDNEEFFDVTPFAQSWTLQMGFPLLIVKRLSDNRIQVTQERFTLVQNASDTGKYPPPKQYK